MRGYTLLDFTEEILKENGKPMRAKEIWSYGKKKGYDRKGNFCGKTPWRTMTQYILKEIKEKQGYSRFEIVGSNPYLFQLRRTKKYGKVKDTYEKGNNKMIRNIQMFIDECKKELKNKKNVYKEMCDRIILYLDNAMKSSPFKNILIQGRVKSEDSLNEKIYRKNYIKRFSDPVDFVNNLPDLIGVRFVCLLNREEKALFDYLLNNYTISSEEMRGLFCAESQKEEQLFLDLTGQPQRQKNNHDIYRITAKWKFNSQYFNVELQIKSLIHYFWGELDHMLFYKNYTYLISNQFYSQLMDKINAELENIDGQLSLLHDQMEKSREKEVQEIKQIASLMLYNKFKAKVDATLKCAIDLREIFDLIVDMTFRNYTVEAGINTKFIEFLSKIDKAQLNFELEGLIKNGKIKKTDISKMGSYIIGPLDKLIKGTDVYWILLFVIYASIFVDSTERNYSNILKKISDDLIHMVCIFEDEIERVEDCEALYDRFTEAIYMGIMDAFEEFHKLSFFIYETNLDKVNRKIIEIVQDLQSKLKEEKQEELINSLPQIRLYIYCIILLECEEIIPFYPVLRLGNNLRKSKDEFELGMDYNLLYEFTSKKTKKLDGLQWRRLFGEEDK